MLRQISAKGLTGHNVIPVIQIQRLGYPEHGKQFRHIRTDRWKAVGQILKEMFFIYRCAPVVPHGAVKNILFYQVLEQMAAVAEFRHVSGPVVRKFADATEAGNRGKGYRNAQLGGRMPSRPGAIRSTFFPVS